MGHGCHMWYLPAKGLFVFLFLRSRPSSVSSLIRSIFTSRSPSVPGLPRISLPKPVCIALPVPSTAYEPEPFSRRRIAHDQVPSIRLPINSAIAMQPTAITVTKRTASTCHLQLTRLPRTRLLASLRAFALIVFLFLRIHTFKPLGGSSHPYASRPW